MRKILPAKIEYYNFAGTNKGTNIGNFMGLSELFGIILRNEVQQMRFCDFLNILHDNISYTCSQSQFILELFSALCGEKNPCKANIKHPFSPALPEGLGNDDPKHRNKLYGKSADYKGLTHTVKEHIRANRNKKTF